MLNKQWLPADISTADISTKCEIVKNMCNFRELYLYFLILFY